MAGSENTFDILQMGAQAGTAYSPGSAVAATVLMPIDNPISFELDRASTIPKQDRGRNVRNSAGAGYHGVRGAGVTVPSQVAFEDIHDFLEAHYAGGVVASSLGGGYYRRVYPFEATTPTLVPRTLEGGNTDASQAQERLISALIDQLTLGFPDIVAPGAYPWALSAAYLALDRDSGALTVSGAGTDEIQTISMDASGGTWIATFMGASTSPLAYNITKANLQTALRALSTINGANVTVTGTDGGPFICTFGGSLGKTDVPMIVTNAAGLTGGASTATVVQTTQGVAPTAVAARTGRETVQGHLTRFYEGDTSTAFGSLAELAGHLKSYTNTSNRNLARRAYGSASDVATRFGFKDMSNGTIGAKVAVSATSKSDFLDIWNATSPASLGERRWRIKAIGTGSKVFTQDLRVAIMAVPFDDVDGERVFNVTGEWVDDSTLGAPAQITIDSQIA